MVVTMAREEWKIGRPWWLSERALQCTMNVSFNVLPIGPGSFGNGVDDGD
jgi:hypothetical protein